jgi:phosphoserine phosphatase RsbU/P
VARRHDAVRPIFPDRKRVGWINRLAQYVLGVPLAAAMLTDAVFHVANSADGTAMPRLAAALNAMSIPLIPVTIAAISFFFINIFRKMSIAASPDEKRRLKLLYTGTTVSMTPLFLLFIASLLFRASMTHLSDWILVPVFLTIFLFPLTLSYVIVVEKAMELRVVIRQGLQYALAKRGLRFVTFIVFLIVTLIALRLATEPTVRRPYQMMVFAFALVILIRLRLQVEKLRAWIDRRFFREAVDAERVLNELGESVRTIVEVKPLLATVTKTISTTMHVRRVAALLRQNGDFATAHAIGFESPPAVRFSARGSLAERLSRSRDAERVSLARADSWAAREPEDRKQLESLETELLLPLAVKDRLLGFLSLGPKLSEEPYSPTDVQLLQSVAAQTGLALENTRLTEAVAAEVAQRERLNRELEIAREVQQRLFPQSGPVVQGLEYAGRCRPASSVGGDYYDFVSMHDGRLGIAIGDISGKGVPAALLMASLQASLRGLAISNPPALSTLMENLNRLVYDASPSNRYATFFYGVYNPTTLVFEYVNGGHNPPMVFRGAEVIRLEDGGPVVGLFGPAHYIQSAIQLHPGDTLVLFTDGVSETMNNDDEEFDEPRLMETIRGGEGLNASDLIDRVMAACDEFAAGAPQHDDMTLVIARVH